MPEIQDFTKYEHCGAYHWKPWYRDGLDLRARYQVPIKLLAARGLLSDASGLDVGCGDGRFLHAASRRGAKVVGMDASATGLRLGRERIAAEVGARLVQGSCYAPPFRRESFDYVVALELIEHLEEPNQFLAASAELLRPGGVFVCSTPNRGPDQMPDEVTDPFHIKEYTAQELKEEMSAAFKDVVVYGGAHRGLGRIARGGGRGLIGRSWRVSTRGIASVLGNPLALVRENPNAGWESLYGVGYR